MYTSMQINVHAHEKKWGCTVLFNSHVLGYLSIYSEKWFYAPLSLGIKYIDKENGAFSDSAVEFDGKLQKDSSAQGWSTTIYHLGVDHIEI